MAAAASLLMSGRTAGEYCLCGIGGGLGQVGVLGSGNERKLALAMGHSLICVKM